MNLTVTDLQLPLLLGLRLVLRFEIAAPEVDGVSLGRCCDNQKKSTYVSWEVRETQERDEADVEVETIRANRWTRTIDRKLMN